MSECKQAQSHEQQIAELKDSRLPKTEREHAAVREIERLEQRLAEAEAKLRWIPVSERLPENHTWVLAYISYRGKPKNCTGIDRVYYANGRFTFWGSVTNWMPLPKPPEGE